MPWRASTLTISRSRSCRAAMGRTFPQVGVSGLHTIRTIALSHPSCVTTRHPARVESSPDEPNVPPDVRGAP
jgi:hypothetical protein